MGGIKKCAVGIVGIGLSVRVRAMGKCSVFLATGPPFCTGPVDGYATGVSIWGGLVEKAGRLMENKWQCMTS